MNEIVIEGIKDFDETNGILKLCAENIEIRITLKDPQASEDPEDTSYNLKTDVSVESLEHLYFGVRTNGNDMFVVENKEITPPDTDELLGKMQLREGEHGPFWICSGIGGIIANYYGRLAYLVKTGNRWTVKGNIHIYSKV